MGPVSPKGGGEGVPENQHEYNKFKKRNAKNPNEKTFGSYEIRCDFFKKRRVQRLGVYCGIMKNSDAKVVYKIAQRKTKQIDN